MQTMLALGRSILPITAHDLPITSRAGCQGGHCQRFDSPAEEGVLRVTGLCRHRPGHGKASLGYPHGSRESKRRATRAQSLGRACQHRPGRGSAHHDRGAPRSLVRPCPGRLVADNRTQSWIHHRTARPRTSIDHIERVCARGAGGRSTRRRGAVAKGPSSK
jgi:hypothetical protein